jgi:hypothetical protein
MRLYYPVIMKQSWSFLIVFAFASIGDESDQVP